MNTVVLIGPKTIIICYFRVLFTPTIILMAFNKKVIYFSKIWYKLILPMTPEISKFIRLFYQLSCLKFIIIFKIFFFG